VIIRVHGKDLEYQILNVCEFNSTRKRMSCVVKAPDGSIKLYTKGADTVILERLGKNQQSVLDHTGQMLEVLLLFKC
jgi:phospholipid-transporting ATPase